MLLAALPGDPPRYGMRVTGVEEVLGGVAASGDRQVRLKLLVEPAGVVDAQDGGAAAGGGDTNGTSPGSTATQDGEEGETFDVVVGAVSPLSPVCKREITGIG